MQATFGINNTYKNTYESSEAISTKSAPWILSDRKDQLQLDGFAKFYDIEIGENATNRHRRDESRKGIWVTRGKEGNFTAPI